MHGGAYMRGLIRGVREVSREWRAYLCVCGGGRGVKDREIQYAGPPEAISIRHGSKMKNF